jgi:alkanesulfonate monooxygenase SsuD/methylene tetrahydromethanopterin reductase-like flavin-dependent oxidoreductase (luciferase family)
MKVGITLPQGCDREYLGLDARTAWSRTVDAARQADALGFDSLWLYDHFQVDPPLIDAPVFEPFVELTAIAGVTSRARLGHLVLAAAYRPAALTAKMISTLDTVSSGRAELGIGAGWKRDEWVAFGYPFPSTSERLAMLADHLEVVTRMLAGGPAERASFEGRHARVAGAYNVPKPVQRPRLPVMVGGNGPDVTWRLAARYADELNLDGLTPQEVERALPVIRQRCEEIGRDPDSLRVSVHTWYESPGVSTPGQRRVDLYGAYAELGVVRVQAFVGGLVDGPEGLEAFAADVHAAGAELA